MDPIQTYVPSDPGTVFSLAGVLYVLLAVTAGMHVVMNKQNEASAVSWLGVIILSPILGAIMYWLFGINRIRRRARAEFGEPTGSVSTTRKTDPGILERVPEKWQSLLRLGEAIHDAPYLSGNAVEPLLNGTEAYPQMLQAIHQACHSVVLSSYIFNHDRIGRQFVEALAAAHERGLLVRVMIDGVGVGYSHSLVKSDRALRRRGVPTARFLSTLSTTGTRFINLRNHRKLLSIDGQVAYLGGLNIADANLTDQAGPHAIQDVHFRVLGPVIDQINALFEDDWQFAAREPLSLPRWQAEADQPASELAQGPVITRALIDGPDENFHKLHTTMLGVIAAAEGHIRIVTPYFLPGRTLTHALQLAALRGVVVDLVVPRKNNLWFVGWAMRANHARLLEYGVRVWHSPAPFDHSKLFLVDDQWSLIGSSNWDSRSLELNFEVNLECLDPAFNRRLHALFSAKRQNAVRLAQHTVEPLPQRLRNNFCRLFSPYL